MGTDQHPRRFAHAFDIQRTVIPSDLFGQVGRPDLIVVDHIAIAPGHGLEARMEMRRHRPSPR